MGRCLPPPVSLDFTNKPPCGLLLTFGLAADESLKFWKIFEKKAGAAGAIGGSASSGKAEMAKQMTIR